MSIVGLWHQEMSFARPRFGWGRRVSLPLFLLALFVFTPGCAVLNKFLGGAGGAGGISATPPTVNASPVRLMRMPTLNQLGAYYCPLVITDQIARLGCAVALGSPPPRQQLVFDFGTTITIHNPNNIPVPALDVLVALKLFQGQGAESLGAVCVSMCGAQDVTCTGAPKPGACTSNQKTIRTMNDVYAAIPGLIAGVATAALNGELRKSTIAAGGDVTLNLTFSLGIDQALRVFERVIKQVVQSQLQHGRPELVVPVSGEGTVFVQLPGVGRLGVGFGPLSTTWRIL